LTTSLACRNTPHHLIWHFQDLISDRFGEILIKIFNLVAQKFPDYIICDGISIQQRLDPISQIKSTVILNGIDTAELKRIEKYRIRIRQEFNMQTNAFVIGHVGRITPWKGQIKLLNAFIKYSKINSDAYLILVGSPLFDDDKYFQKIKEIISQNGLDERVIMPGYRSDLNAIFSAMDLFIYPSLEKDTSPLALLSAISSGLPVAISSIESLEELFKNNDAIDRFDPRDTNSLLSIFKKYEDKELRLKVGIKNRSYGKKYFDIACHTKSMNEVFNSV
jgi:glycosyltransferase involved in cell wall biosynthesis